MMRLHIGIVVATLLGACTPPQESAEQVGSAPVLAADTRITMERLPCYGTCPVYTLDIAADGTVSFTGTAHVDTMGSATGRIAPAAVAELAQALVRGGFLTFAERYNPGEKACGDFHTDAPRVNTTLVYDGRVKRVEHDYGCQAAPPSLRQLQELIDSTTMSWRWVGRR